MKDAKPVSWHALLLVDRTEGSQLLLQTKLLSCGSVGTECMTLSINLSSTRAQEDEPAGTHPRPVQDHPAEREGIAGNSHLTVPHVAPGRYSRGGITQPHEREVLHTCRKPSDRSYTRTTLSDARPLGELAKEGRTAHSRYCAAKLSTLNKGASNNEDCYQQQLSSRRRHHSTKL